MEKLRQKTNGLIIFSDYKKLIYKILYYVMILIIIITIILTVFPPMWLFLSGFKSAKELYSVPFSLFPKKFDFNKVTDLWNTLEFGKYFVNSLWVILGALVCSIVFNGLLAYAISVIKPIGYKVVYILIMVSLMIPVVLNMGPLFNNIVRFGLVGTYIPLWLVYGANPFYFILFKTYFDSLPKTLFEAAELDGCNKLQLFTKIIVPLSKPIIMVVSIFTINAAWSDFLLPYLVLLTNDSKQTVMVKIYLLYSNMGTAMNFSPDKLLLIIGLAMIPPIILFVLFQKRITSSVATTGIK